MRNRQIHCVKAGIGASAAATSRDAVAQGGTFEFVSRGGGTDLYYDLLKRRGTVGDLSGLAVMDNRLIHLSDFAVYPLKSL